MCGILAYYSKYFLSKEIINNCLNSLKSIRHRGPDGEGLVLINTENGNFNIINTPETPGNLKLKNNEDFNNYNLILGHRRLKIIDLSDKAHQPMRFKNNWISYNGEIYNYLELKKELITKGYEFQSSSDTEVIIKAYDYWGESCLNKFNGMWSFVIWDNDKKSTFISNDRFGVKPLYYFKSDKSLIYCSEIKQFNSFNEIDFSVNKKNCELYLNHGYQPLDKSTYFNSINRFPNGTFLLFNYRNKNQNNTKSFYSIHNIQKNTTCNFKDEKAKFKTVFSDAISIRHRSDVEIGLSISGGIDSTLLLQFSDKIYSELYDIPLKSFSAISPNRKGDESIFINEVIKNYNIESFYVNPYDDFEINDFNNFLNNLEFPPTTMSFYAQWLVSRMMKSRGVTINLVGQGADEVFGGYQSHYFRYFRWLIFKGQLITYLTEINAYSEIRKIDKAILHRIVLLDIKTLLMFKFGLKKLDNKLLNYWNKINSLSEFLKNDFNVFQLPFFLHSDDRNSMGHSIETRHPFLDYRIVELGYSLPDNFLLKNGWSKYFLRDNLDDSLNLIKWRKDKKGYTVPDNDLMKKIIPSSDNYQKDFRNYCLNKLFK